MNRFEQRLLTDLRAKVAERAEPEPSPHRGFRWSRWTLATGVVGAAVIALGALTIGGSGEAWAVEQDGDTITVTIERFSDAEGLERRFAELGITAEVDFAPPGKKCADGRYTRAELPDSPDNVFGTATYSHGDLGDNPVTFSFQAYNITPNRTVVITNKTLRDVASNWREVDPEGADREWPSLEIAEGPVEPCTLIPRG